MAMRDGSLLINSPTAAATAKPTITHGQLRHLVSCPQRRGVVYYLSDYSILEHDLLNPSAPSRSILKLDYLPTCFATAAHPSNPHALLVAAGGIHSNIHISLHTLSQPSPVAPHPPPKTLWSYDTINRNVRDIVNYMFFSPAELTDGTSLSRATPAACGSSSSATANSTTTDLRLVVCGNDASVRFYDIALRTRTRDDPRLQPCGIVCLDTCVNHASISPDGRTLLCAGDTPHAYLYRIIPGASLAFEFLAKYTIPLPPPVGALQNSWTRTTPTRMSGQAASAMSTPRLPIPPPVSSTAMSTSLSTFQHLTHARRISTPTPSYTAVTTHVFPLAHSLMPPRACFTTAWTSDGHKFAIAAQEGALAVWDVRSSVPVWVFWTGVRSTSPRNTGAAINTGDSDGSWEWADSGGAGQRGWWTAASNRSAGVDVGTTAGAGTAPVPPLVNLSSPEAVTLPITTPFNINNSGTEGTGTDDTNSLDPPVAQADPMRVILGVVGIHVDPRFPVQTYSETDPEANPIGASGPANGIRNVRFSAGEEGRELCAFVEHTKYIHVIDARTFDPATHRVFVLPNAEDVVAELARNETQLAGTSGTTAQGASDAPRGAESGSAASSEQGTRGQGEEQREPDQARAEMVWALMPGEDRQRALGAREEQGDTRSVNVDNATLESNMQLATPPERSRSSVSMLDSDSPTATVQAALRGSEHMLGPLMEPNHSRTRSRVPYHADYLPPGMRSRSRSPTLAVPFPRFRSQSRDSASPSVSPTIIRRSSGPAHTVRSVSRSRSRSPPIPTLSPSPDSRAAPTSSMEPEFEPAPDPNPEQAALSALRVYTQRRQEEPSGDTVSRGSRGMIGWSEAWPTQDSRESRERVVNVSEWAEGRSVAVEGSNSGGRSDSWGGVSEDLSRSASQNWNPWVGRTWNNSGSRIASGPPGSGGRTEVTAEVMEFLDADGDIVPRESDEHETEQQNRAQNRNRNRPRDPPEYQRQHENVTTTSESLLLTPPTATRHMQPSLRSSPPSPFRPPPRDTPPPHTLQASSTAHALPSVVESIEPQPPHDPHTPHDPHIAGVCFDPTGEWVYVAGRGGIVEWRVREREEGRGIGVGGWL